MCIKWDCNVNMKVDNFLFWLMKKTKEKTFKCNEERFQRYMPKMFTAIERTGLDKYQKYQEMYGDKNRKFLERCADWRKKELRRIRFLDKLEDLCSTWTWSDSEEDGAEDSDSEDDKSYKKNDEHFSISDNLTFSSNSSVNTVIDTATRYNEYPETESLDINASSNVAAEEIVDNLEEVNTQSFLPQTTSTQN